MKRKYTRALFITSLSFSAMFIVILVMGAKPVSIRYHKWRIGALLNTKPKFDPATGLYYYDDEWSDAFEKHRDKLVALAYLHRKEFQLTSIESPSLRFRRLWEELHARFSNNPFTQGLGYDSNSPATIVVWD
jgi:hypothetical protein